jgi:hypothetical protein
VAKDVHADDQFLQDHLKAIFSEMSWRRELEFRLMQFLLVFYPIIGSAMISLFQSKVDVQTFSLTALGAGFLIVVASIFVTDRIIHEHRAYAELGKEAQNIWLYFGLFETGAYLSDKTILPKRLNDDQKGYGQGKGYRKTLALIWFITVTMLSILFTLVRLKT